MKDLRIRHNLSKSRIYRIWIGMRARCDNPKCNNYKHYGARGISVCPEWNNSENGFINFYSWAMKNGYDETLSIDRINNNGNYSPDNCRWVTQSVQCINMRHKNTSGYIGICKHSADGAWYGRVKVDKKVFYTGRSKNIHEAARMRNEFIINNHLPNKLNEVNEDNGYI